MSLSTSPRRASAGDKAPRIGSTSAQLEAFYRELFAPLVRRAVRRHGLSNEDARDVVQESFVLAIGKLDPTGNAAAWLRQVVDYTAVNLKRTAARRVQLLARWDRVDRDETGRPPSPHDEV